MTDGMDTDKLLATQQAEIERVLKENADLRAKLKELELELWKWPPLMNEVRAKLERAREGLHAIAITSQHGDTYEHGRYHGCNGIARATLEELK